MGHLLVSPLQRVVGPFSIYGWARFQSTRGRIYLLSLAETVLSRRWKMGPGVGWFTVGCFSYVVFPDIRDGRGCVCCLYGSGWQLYVAGRSIRYNPCLQVGYMFFHICLFTWVTFLIWNINVTRWSRNIFFFMYALYDTWEFVKKYQVVWNYFA